MIADRTWAGWWSIWTEHFLVARGRPPLSDAAAAEFRASMERRLTTEEFDEAARVVFDTAKWFPTPSEVVLAVEQRIARRGFEAWGAIDRIARETPAGERLPQLRALDERCQRAIHAMRDAFDRLDMDDPLVDRTLVPMRIAFLQAYGALVDAELAPRHIGTARKHLIAPIKRGASP